MCPVTDNLSLDDFDSKEELFEAYKAQVEALWYEKERYKSMLFNPKKERFIPTNPDQLELEGIVVENEESISVKIKAHEKRLKKKPKRDILPEHLPREEQILIPPEVETNPDQFEKIGENVSEQLEIIPAKFFVNKIVRPKFKEKSSGNIVCENSPENLFSKYLAGDSVIIDVLTRKYVDHSPLYRINKIYRRENIHIPESTMVGWITKACEYLEPVYNAIKEKVVTSKVIQADETPIPVLAKDKTHRGYFYCYAGDKNYAVFDYKNGRGREGPKKFLEGFNGFIQTDGYAGYNEVVRENGLTQVGCLAHQRRKFKEALDAGVKVAEEALVLIGKLYDIERDIRQSKITDEGKIREIRQEKSLPIYNKLSEWVKSHHTQNTPQSPIGKATTYFINQEDKTRNYLEYGCVDIDNNFCERAIRPLTIGRKNYLFMGSEEGARRAAIIYSLVLTCRIRNKDFSEYLKELFQAYKTTPNKPIAELLP